MAYKYKDIDEDGRISTFVEEEHENEILNAFYEADNEADEEVVVMYMIDSRTGEDIELWRCDYLELSITN